MLAHDQSDLCKLLSIISEFASARDWDRFHSPKNLSMALIVEAAELIEHFQWLTEQQSRELSADQLHLVAEEIADVFIYTLRISQVLDIDILQAAAQKMRKNEQRYPVELSKGKALKAAAYQLREDM